MANGNGSGRAKTSAPKEVVAQSFRLVDEHGRTRALLARRMDGATRDHGAAIWFYNAAGKPQLVIGVSDFEPAARIVISDFEGNITASLGHGKSTSLMIGNAEVPQITLGILDGRAGLAFSDDEGNPQAVMGEAGAGPEIVLFDGSGNPIWRARDKE